VSDPLEERIVRLTAELSAARRNLERLLTRIRRERWEFEDQTLMQGEKQHNSKQSKQDDDVQWEGDMSDGWLPSPPNRTPDDDGTGNPDM
jgi:hypothetical protein